MTYSTRALRPIWWSVKAASIFSITHGTGWSWPVSGAGCAVQADVNETPIAPPNTPTTGTVADSFPASSLTGHNPANLTLTDPSGLNTIDSATAISATCHLRRTYRATVRHTTTFTAKKRGNSKTKRTLKAYLAGGSCNWGGDGRGGGITTCLFAQASIRYSYRLPVNAKLLSVTHTVTSGIARCRNKRWVVRHVGRTYSATFSHGNRSGFSQCDIHAVAFHYRKTTATTVTRVQTTTASTNWP